MLFHRAGTHICKLDFSLGNLSRGEWDWEDPLCGPRAECMHRIVGSDMTDLLWSPMCLPGLCPRTPVVGDHCVPVTPVVGDHGVPGTESP